MEDFHRIALYWFGITWISWPLSHAIVILDSMKINGVPYGGAMLTLILLTSWISDVAGFYGESMIYLSCTTNKPNSGQKAR